MNITKEDKVLKVRCEKDLLFFTRYIYKENTNRNFKVAPHFVEIAKTLHKVHNGEINRLVINIPPRYGKVIPEYQLKMYQEFQRVGKIRFYLHLNSIGEFL